MKTFVSPDDLANARTKTIKERQQADLPSVTSKLNSAISSYTEKVNKLSSENAARISEINDPRYGYHQTGEGNPEAANTATRGYRGDSKEWETRVNNIKAEIEAEAKAISEILYDYEEYFDPAWVKQVRANIKSSGENLKGISSVATALKEHSQNAVNNAEYVKSVNTLSNKYATAEEI